MTSLHVRGPRYTVCNIASCTVPILLNGKYSCKNAPLDDVLGASWTGIFAGTSDSISEHLYALTISAMQYRQK